MNKEQFIKEITKLEININQEIIKKLDKYYQILLEENKKYNLTNITKLEDVYLKHFYDSLTICKIIKLKDQNLIDIGTGAGFPGIVLKIFFPELKVTLLDSTTKKCEFLKKVIDLLELKQIKVLNYRAEEYAHINREEYDIVTSRAVAPLKHLLEYSVPLLKEKGYFISLKSNIENELINIENYYKKLNLTNETKLEFNLPNNAGFRTLYKVQKTKKTDLKYPRNYSQIKKKEI